jgi:hypothetical protein
MVMEEEFPIMLTIKRSRIKISASKQELEPDEDLINQIQRTLRERITLRNRGIPICVLAKEFSAVPHPQLIGALRELQSRKVLRIKMIDWGEFGIIFTNC